jgi:hypothetical protein
MLSSQPWSSSFLEMKYRKMTDKQVQVIGEDDLHVDKNLRYLVACALKGVKTALPG